MPSTDDSVLHDPHESSGRDLAGRAVAKVADAAIAVWIGRGVDAAELGLSPARVFMVLAVVLPAGVVCGALLGVITVLSWMQPVDMRVIPGGAVGHLLALAASPITVIASVRSGWRMIRELRGRPVGRSNERVGWVLSLTIGAPLLGFWLWDRLWLGNISIWDAHELVGQLAFSLCFVLAPLIGRRIDRALTVDEQAD
jgi:hypothetical protein